MDSINSLHIAQGALLVFWGLWLALAALGHVLDGGTNRHLLAEMMRMTQLQQDPLLGKGLLHRAWPGESAPRVALYVIALVQFCIVALLLRAGWLWLTGADPQRALAAADLALSAFGAIWCFFLLGGLWFGYWIKTPLLQLVHLNLAALSLASLVFVHQRF